jgi:hypothetical protein
MSFVLEEAGTSVHGMPFGESTAESFKATINPGVAGRRVHVPGPLAEMVAVWR